MKQIITLHKKSEMLINFLLSNFAFEIKTFHVIQFFSASISDRGKNK